jgi:hypothetical protein
MDKKLIIAMQIGSVKTFHDLIKKVSHLDNGENFFFISILSDIRNQICPVFQNQKIIYHDNIGMDIGPFLLQLNFLLQNDISDCSYIYKIHTKSNEKWLDELLDIDLSTDAQLICSKKWLKPLDAYNRETILDLCESFEIPNIYYDDHFDFEYNIDDIDIDFYSNYYDVKISTQCPDEFNRNYILEHAIFNKYVLNESQIKCKNRKNVKFVAGTIFAMQTSKLFDLFKNIDIIKLYNMLEHGYSINDHPTYVHALERILTGFLY